MKLKNYLAHRKVGDSMSKKNKTVWFFHHYATPPSISGLTRPFEFAKELQNYGYNCNIFSSSFLHFAGYNISEGNLIVTKKIEEDVEFNFIKTNNYQGNRFSRVMNMIIFAFNLLKVAKNKIYDEKPDVIIASSPHPLTCITGIIVAKRYKIPCLVEIRDLWPETIFAYGSLNKDGFLSKILYLGEKWIYKKADGLIFTMEGGRDYIVDKKWNNENGGPVNLKRVFNINNGVDIKRFDYNSKQYEFDDSDLLESNTFKVIYAGSIRKINNIKLIIEAAQYIQSKSNNNIKFIIYGDGTEKIELEEYCKKNKIDNVVFKGKVDKKYIPYILTRADLNILNYTYNDIWKYGGSQNKVFEYMASGKPILSTIKMGYDIILKNKAGISLSNQTYKDIGEAVIDISNLEKNDYRNMCYNARNASLEYDFKTLTKKLIAVIDEILE